jgi:twitching motility protein PilT
MSVQKFNLDKLLGFAVGNKASDIHLHTGKRPFVRIRGGLVPLNMDVLELRTMERIVNQLMSESQLEEYEVGRAVDLGYESPKDGSRFRISVYHRMGTPSIAMRHIENAAHTVDDLGLPLALRVVCNRPQGLVLVTGPTGAGKSTTLAALINEINATRQVHILTAEDPVEFVFNDQKSTITQLEVGRDTPNFSKALKHALRQDPDIIMIGEMRDEETMEIALTAAETGHLIFSTLHTNSAAQSITRIIDAFPPSRQDQIRLQLSQTLLAVFSQKLLNRQDTKGRIAAMEIMFNSPAVKELIRKGEINQIPDLITRSVEYYRMQTIDQSLIALIANRVIKLQDGLSVSQNPEELQLTINKLGLEVFE